jgi:hypothetical protein
MSISAKEQFFKQKDLLLTLTDFLENEGIVHLSHICRNKDDRIKWKEVTIRNAQRSLKKQIPNFGKIYYLKIIKGFMKIQTNLISLYLDQYNESNLKLPRSC